MISTIRQVFRFRFCISCQFYLLAILLVGFLAGCARVNVQKIPTPTQYTSWSDKDQKEADSIKGFRFYLSRPFVNVFESFPVHADVHIVEGVVSPDGKYVLVTVPAGSKLAQLLGAVGLDDEIPARIIGPPQVELRAAPDDESIGQAGEIEDVIPPAAKPKAEEPPAEPPTGIDERAVTNDNNAYAYQPMRGNMDIVYLPDFDEQYAVTSKANLGNVKFQLNFGQGWSLQGFNSRVDNSAINRRIFKLIDEAQEIASRAAPLLLGLPPLPAGAADLVKPQSGAIDLAGVPGTRVSLKVTVVHYVAKGLYPVIKPRELHAAKAGTGRQDLSPGGQGGFFMNLATGKAGEVSPVAQGAQPRATIPVYPYQYLSFNTFQFLALELVRPDTDPFDVLYDKTGTAGDPGDRQTGDLFRYIIPSTDKADDQAVTPGVAPGSAEDVAQRLANALSHEEVSGTRLEIEEPAAQYSVRSATAEGRKVKVEIEFEGTRPAELTDAQIKEHLVEVASGIDKSLSQGEFGNIAEAIELKSSADIGGQSAVVGAPTKPAVAVPNPVVVGLSAAEIRAIQTALCLRDKSVDGIWGPRTNAALIRYQKRNNISPADGKLNVTLRDQLLGLNGLTVNIQCRAASSTPGPTMPADSIAAALIPDQVRWIQLALCRKGSQADGKWGPKTSGALRRWQIKNARTPADGVLTAAQRDDFLKLTGAQIAETCP